MQPLDDTLELDPRQRAALVAALAGKGIDDSDTPAMPPVPETGPYGQPSVTIDRPVAAPSREQSPGSSPPWRSAAPAQHPAPAVQPPGYSDMRASGLRGQTIPDGRGGLVPSTNSRYDPSTGDFLPTGAYATASTAPSPQPAAASTGAVPQVQTASTSNYTSGDTSAPAEDATSSSYRALHDEQYANYQRNMALAKQAAAAGSDPKPFIAAGEASYRAAASIAEKKIDYEKPAAPPQKVAPGEYILNSQTGRYEQAVPEKLQTKIVNLGDGTFQAVNKATGEPIGAPVGHPKDAPRPVTDAERKTWGLPGEGAFTIAPGEAPKQISGAGSEEGKLDQPAIDYMANRVIQGDNSGVNSLGYSKIGSMNRSAVIKRAAELGGPDASAAATSQIQGQVGLGGRKAEARTSGQLGARIDIFTEEGRVTGDLAIEASAAVPRGQWVPLNAIEQMGEAAASNPQLSAFQAANLSFANTYSRAASLSGAMTDSSRDHALAVLNVAKNPTAYAAAVNQLRKEMAAMQSAVGTIRARQQGESPAAAPPPAPGAQPQAAPPGPPPPGKVWKWVP